MSFPNNPNPNWPNQPVPFPQFNPYPYYYGQPSMPQTAPYQNNAQTGTRTNNPRQNQSLLGRIVNNENEIRPDEVPMDGSVAFFPQADGTCIHAKCWNNNGLIEKRTYMLVSPENSEANAAQDTNLNEVYKDLSAKLDDISKMLKRNNRPYRDNRSKYNDPPVNEEEHKNV